MNQQFEVGQNLNLTIKKIGINGEGIGYYNRMAIFVHHALPEENVDIEITEVFPNRLVAKIIETKKVSPHRVTPFCPIYESCGGCQLQHFAPSEVAKSKRGMIIEAIHRYTRRNIPLSIIKDTITGDNEQGYRNKAGLPVRFDGKKNHVGMYEANSRNFIEMDACPIQHPVVNEVIDQVLLLLDKYRVNGLDDKNRKGDLSSLVVRTSQIDEVQVTFVMLKDNTKLKGVVKDLVAQDKRVVSAFKVIENKRQSVGFFNPSLTKLYGKDTINERLSNFNFELKPEAFFQLNPSQANKFYMEMKRLAQLRKNDVVIDAFAGSAPISHYIANDCKQVYAIEIDKEACDSARISLAKNNINNVTILQSDFKRALSGLQKKKIDVMFFDPPRVGLGKNTIDLILQARPRKIIYGSCNPSTLAKDLNLLMKDYKIIEVVPLDMFPQTSLVESVSLLELK